MIIAVRKALPVTRTQGGPERVVNCSNDLESVRNSLGGAEYLIETKRPSATNLDRIQPGIRKIGTQPVQQF